MIGIIAVIYMFELFWVVENWLIPMKDKQNKLDQELNDLKEELKEIKKDMYIMDKGEDEE